MAELARVFGLEPSTIGGDLTQQTLKPVEIRGAPCVTHTNSGTRLGLVDSASAYQKPKRNVL